MLKLALLGINCTIIVPVNYSGKAVGYDPDSKRVVLSVSNDADKLQQWSVTNLSGSFRFINPF